MFKNTRNLKKYETYDVTMDKINKIIEDLGKDYQYININSYKYYSSDSVQVKVENLDKENLCDYNTKKDPA